MINENICKMVDDFLYEIVGVVMCNSKFYFSREDFEECLVLLYEEMDKYDIGYFDEKNLNKVWNKYFDDIEKEGGN